MPEINEIMGQYSELFMLLASGTYTVAFIAFAWDLARSSRTLRAVDLKAATVAPTQASADARVPVSAGTRTTVPADRVASGAGGPAGMAERPSSTAKRTAAEAAGAGQTAGPDMHYAPGRRVPARIGVALTVLGALIHGAGVVTRALGAGRVPWGNMYEFTTTGAMLVMAVFLISLIFQDLRFLGTLITGLALIMLMAGAIAYPTPVTQLIPALQSYWLIIHVSIAVLASAVFTLTFCLSVLQLIKTRHQKAAQTGSPRFLRLVPAPVALEQLA
ncbi:MAG: cytochrome c biogenesis protein, partial [Actinomycetes bacterium]